MKLTLNMDAGKDGTKALKQAASKKKAANESIEDAWRRILSGNLSEPERRRLVEVKSAMEAGTIGRLPAEQFDKRGNPKKFSKAEALRLHKVLAEQQREQKLADMVAHTPDSYRLITDEDSLAQVISDLKNETIIAIDTETTGLDVYTDVIVGTSIKLPQAGYDVYIPVAHKDAIQLSREYVLEQLRPFIEDEALGKVLHNAVYDRQMFKRHGLTLEGIAWDTQTAMHLLNENEPSFKLKDLAPKYLGVESDTFDELFGRNAQFAEIPLDIALVYAAKDTDLTWRLYEFQEAHMRKLPTIYKYYTEVEVPLLEVIADLEANGYVLDLDFAREYGEKLAAEAAELADYLTTELAEHYDGEGQINLNSSQQMRPSLSKAIGKELPNLDAKKTLKPLKGEFEIIDKLLEYKRITKLSGTYIDKLPLKQNPTTKRWHSRFNPMGTVTGRFSSGKDDADKSEQGFNVQNQPEDARKMFVAPPGKVLVGADFKAQEIRCVAYLSGEPVLINAFLEERDPYASMASTFYKRPYEEVYKNPDGSDTKERKQMKVVWLATLYGMSDYSLAEMLGTGKKEATRFKEELFGSMPRLSAWLNDNKDFVQKNGYVWADGNARKRRLPDAKLVRKNIPYGKWNDPKYEEARKHNSKISRAMRQATNARVQGSSSIQTKVTMLRAHEYCKKKPGWHLWATVHDELIFEVPADFTPEEANDIRDIMLHSYKWGDTVPNGTDIEVMSRWGDGVPIDQWFANKR